MREIKFRVWDKENKKMVLPDNVSHNACYNFEGWDVSDVFAVNHILESEKYIFEQYTGLKDKNGKEIYDGDIVRSDDDIVKIDFTEGSFDGWKAFGDNFSFYEHICNFYSICEVIGNIHENPELLTN